MLTPLRIEIIAQGDLQIPSSPEPHLSFVENALEKARHASRLSGLPALADDSGVCVDALHGAPGIYSARFSGPKATDEENNRYLIEQLKSHTNRSAHYTCALVLVRHPEDPEPLIALGQWYGEIIDTPRGQGGFGYDPHFLIPELGLTAAELSPEEKNQRGHRGKALAQLIQLLKAHQESSHSQASR